MRRLTLMAWAFATVLAVLSGGARAQFPGMEESAKVATAEAVLSVSGVRPGETVTAAVIFTVGEGWHVNSNQPSLDYLQPTLVHLDDAPGLTVGAPGYPVAKEAQFQFTEEPISVFEGRNVIPFPVTVAPGAQPGTLTLKGRVAYQPCNDVACFPPAEKEFTLEVPVVAAGAEVAPAHQDVFGSLSGGSGGSGSGGAADRYAEVLQKHGLAAFLGVVFLGGILLNLTPCVYPMIAVTMAIFGARAGDPKARVLGRSILYVLGMATMYTALGVFAGLTGSLFGGILQSVWVRVGIAAFMLVLALGMFGAYTLQAPPALANALGGTSRTGAIGIYLSGLVVGIFAAPCVGPVVLFLLAMVGERQDALFGAVSFFTLALGLGSPYILLAFSTGLLAKMPRSGGWMEWVKHVFGVILLGVAAWYLILALAPAWVGLVIPITLVLGAIYLGFFDRHGREMRVFQAAKVGAGAAAALGLYLGAGAVAQMRAPAEANIARWPAYSDAAFEQARAEGRPIVMDFSASWCAACRELEHKTFTDPRVQQALDGYARFKIDLDGAHSAQANALQRKWKVTGLPAIIFLNAEGQEIESARIGGFRPPAAFLAAIPET